MPDSQFRPFETHLDRDAAREILRNTLIGADDGELFLERCRRKGNLLNGDSDYELILSFYAFALKTFGTDKVIRASGIRFLSASFSFVRNKNIIKRSKCMEALGFLLGSNAIDEDEKREVGALIGTIATL